MQSRKDVNRSSYRAATHPVLSGEGAQAGFHPQGAFLPASVLIVCALLVILVVHFFPDGLNASVTGDEAQGRPAPPAVEGTIAAVFTPEVRRWEAEIVSWAGAAGIDPNLLATVMQIESCGDARALSRSGAMGLFQVMPFHFESGEDGFDPQTNARRGADYLRKALEARGGDVRAAFAGYNGGINGASRPESEWADETMRYVYWGTGIYQDATAGKTRSAVLEEWLSAGGTHLCAEAARGAGGSGIARTEDKSREQAASYTAAH